jgi:hypothetical protein
MYPTSWGSLPSTSAEAFKADFEAAMIGLWDSFSDQASRLLIDMGTYFSTFEPAGSDDCYSELVQCLIKNHLVRTTAFGTLNYECILEVAASHLGLKLAYLAESPPLNNLLIWKLHGSCNVLAKANVHGINIVLSDPSSQGYYEGDVEVVDLPEVRRRYREDFAIPPVMSLYAPGKPTLVGRTFLEQTRAQWASWVRRSTVVVVIGAKPNAGDPHVWDPIINSKAKIWWIGSTSEAEFRQLAGQIHMNRLHPIAETFEEGLPRLRRLLGELT